MSAEAYMDALWYRCYGAYLDHVQPTDGRPRCAVCWTADTPNDGCADGVRLWGAYRLARIGRTEEGAKTP